MIVRDAATGSHALCGLSRRPPGPFPDSVGDWRKADLSTGEGLAAALDGVDVVIHAASDPQRPDLVDVHGTTLLTAAARGARIRHFVYVSIVGVDRIPYAYYRRKHAAEEVTRASGMPFTIVRATQFHSFLDLLLRTVGRVPLLLPLPARFRIQSVEIGEVAGRAWADLTGRRKVIVPLPLPTRIGRAFRSGANTAPDGERGAITWRDWLSRRAAAQRL